MYICMYIYIYTGPDYGLGKLGKCLGPTKPEGLRKSKQKVKLYFSAKALLKFQSNPLSIDWFLDP